MNFYFENVGFSSMYNNSAPEIELHMALTPETTSDLVKFNKLLKTCRLPQAKETLVEILTNRVSSKDRFPSIKNVYFNDPVTVVLWDDGTKTTVRCQKGDTYSKETGLSLCIAKKAMGNKSNFNDIFKKWIPEEKPVRGFRSKLNLDEWDKVENTYSDKLYRCAKEACAPKEEYIDKGEFCSCHNCVHGDEPCFVCMYCIDKSHWKLKE